MSLNFKALDKGKGWKDKADLMKVVEALGYRYITEAVVMEYERLGGQGKVARALGKKQPWVCYTMKYVKEGVGSTRAKQRVATESDRKNLVFENLDAGREWRSREELETVAKEMGCQYITEAFYIFYSGENTSQEICLKFGRTSEWVRTVADYMGLRPRTHGGYRWGVKSEVARG